MDIIALCLIIINALSFVLMLVDKYNAQNKLRRIPERLLLTVAAIGGSLGCFVGMKVCRHKTKHKRFSLGVPVMILIHIAILWYFMPLL
ncbi:MAG: DUF1294 domain-containing protein [Oscillospiraceae bacterium]|nr:DUF1294 domain-containing protein [Oscillospiraceae bacterium]